MAAFNGDVCVGAKKWDIGFCGGGICDLPVMGDSGDSYTIGYMQSGDMPTFKIYDASDDKYYNAIASENLTWSNNIIHLINNLNVELSENNGCTDPLACNYNLDALYDDGSCEYPVENFSCEGIPIIFEFTQSAKQSFYLFESIMINNIEIDGNDWVAAFNGDICVGAKKWDISQCNGGICDLAVLGDDGNSYSSGYMKTGDLPSFKVYDTSENIYYDVFSSIRHPWANNQYHMIEYLNTSIEYCLSYPLLHKGANLRGFSSLPEPANVDQIFSSLGTDILGVIWEGEACMQTTEGIWVGSHCEINTQYGINGYWIIIKPELGNDYQAQLCINNTIPINDNTIYWLHKGANLRSIPIRPNEQALVSDAFPDDVKQHINGIIWEGEACMQTTDGNWVGSHCSFWGTYGYWIIVNSSVEELYFTFHINDVITQ